MAGELFQFVWRVSDSGYRWLQAKVVFLEDEHSPGDRYLTDGQWMGHGRYRQYEPLKHFSGLFRTFADTPPTWEGIKGFADRFGLLGEGQWDISAVDGSFEQGRGEQRGDWEEAITTLRETVRVWDAIQGEDVATLANYVTWRDDPLEPLRVTAETDRIASSNAVVLAHYQSVTPGDLVTPARCLIQAMITRRLDRRANLVLRLDDERAQLRIAIAPRSLLGALWLQFALAVDGDKHYRACDTCGTWFEVSPTAARKSRKYCSNACRVKAHRRRQAQAKGTDE